MTDINHIISILEKKAIDKARLKFQKEIKKFEKCEQLLFSSNLPYYNMDRWGLFCSKCGAKGCLDLFYNVDRTAIEDIKISKPQSEKSEKEIILGRCKNFLKFYDDTLLNSYKFEFKVCLSKDVLVCVENKYQDEHAVLFSAKIREICARNDNKNVTLLTF